MEDGVYARNMRIEMAVPKELRAREGGKKDVIVGTAKIAFGVGDEGEGGNLN
jgi:hypothetical protein